MIGGQLLDLQAEGRSLSLEELEGLHRAKTGALILAGARMGAMAALAPPENVAAFETFGKSLGLAFQIQDDVADVTKTSSAMGKTTGRDSVLGKSTYPALLGVDEAKLRAEQLIAQGTATLKERKLLTANLAEVANLMLARNA
jgi:geranylgeranyl pyrophosphate synthase